MPQRDLLDVRVTAPTPPLVSAVPAPEEPRRVSPRPAAGPPVALRHVAIIPDGNRRWAAARGLPVWDGVRQGVRTAEAIFEAVRTRNIPWCTFWAASYDNLQERPSQELRVLNELFVEWFDRLAENATVRRERVRVRVLGEWRGLLSARATEAIERILARTAEHTGPALTFLIGYDGDRELVAAVSELLRRGTGSRERGTTLKIDDLRKHAWTKELPEVDLLIRTGSWDDPHRSANFLPLLTSNVQEAYPRVYWPAFAAPDLDETLRDFARRERRLGR